MKNRFQQELILVPNHKLNFKNRIFHHQLKILQKMKA